MVDVGALHHHHLFFLHLASDGMTNGGMALVAVHTLQLHGLAVDVVVATSQTELVLIGRSVLDFNLAETYDCRNGFQNLALLVQQFTNEGVAVGSLGCPLLGRNHVQCSIDGSFAGKL